MAKAVWGLDISATSLKAIRLENQDGQPVITDAELFQFSSTSVTGDDEEGSGGNGEVPPSIRDGFAQFQSRCNLKNDHIVCSIPGHTTFNRFIELPPVESERTSEIIQYEAQQNIPFPLEEVVWDYHEIEREYEPGEEREVVIFAIKKDIVNRTLGHLKSVGISVDTLQFSPIALYNYVEFDYSFDDTTAILDFGSNSCDLVVIEGYKYWVRNVPMSAKDITKSLMDELNLSFEKAEKLKKRAGTNKEARKQFQHFRPVYRELVQEIHRSIGFYKSMSRGAEIDRIVLTGGGAKSYKLADFIQQNMQKPTKVVRDFQRIPLGASADQEEFQKHAPMYAAAAGLALQDHGLTKNQINLLPDQVLRQKKYRKKRPYLIAAAIMLLAILGGMYWETRKQIQNIEKQDIQPSSALLEDYNSLKKQTENAKKDPNDLGSKLQQVGHWIPPRNLSIKLWNAAQRSVPNNQKLRHEINQLMTPVYKRNQGKRPIDIPSFETYLTSDDPVQPDVHKNIRNRLTKQLWLLDFHYQLDGRKGSIGTSEEEDEENSSGNLKVNCEIQGVILRGDIVRRERRNQESRFIKQQFSKAISQELGITKERLKKEPRIQIEQTDDQEVTHEDIRQLLFSPENITVNLESDLLGEINKGSSLSGGGSGGGIFEQEDQKSSLKYRKFSLQLDFPQDAFTDEEILKLSYLRKILPNKPKEGGSS